MSTAAAAIFTPPQPDASAPVLTILVPCLNESVVIGEFVDWCRQGLRAAGIEGEILIADSSSDESPQIAAAHGAKVISVPKRGLGRAYIDALPHARGKYIILGDCDLTYDFRRLAGFVEKLDAGYQFVMGTRMKGAIEAGAMPPLHRYFGTPLTTSILNLIYGTHFSDIHCGMRAMTTDALRRIDLQSQGWEYASEMVLKAARMGLSTCEIPIDFFKDQKGRQSHHKRMGWLSPWKAGWANLKAMFVFAPDALLLKPALLLLAIGLFLVLILFSGPKQLAGIGFDLHWMLLGVTFTTIGYSGLHLALLSRAYYAFRPHWREQILRWFSYNRGMTAGFTMIGLGILINLDMVYHWLINHLQLSQIYYNSVFGLLLIILGIQTITHTLILQMVLFSRRGEG